MTSTTYTVIRRKRWTLIASVDSIGGRCAEWFLDNDTGEMFLPASWKSPNRTNRLTDSQAAHVRSLVPDLQ